jgi:hypothetical protein
MLINFNNSTDLLPLCPRRLRGAGILALTYLPEAGKDACSTIGRIKFLEIFR